MKIFIYWNYKDSDSKNIYQFLKKTTFINMLEECNDVFLWKKFDDFIIDETLNKELTSSDIILFFTHGDDDAILKYRYFDELLRKRYIFIDKENADILSGKKVIAICCRSAKQLGKYCVTESIQSKFFIGFQDDIIYNDGFSNNFKSIVYKTYSAAFNKALESAYTNKWNAEKFTLLLRKYITDMLTKEILESTDRKLGSVSSISFHRKTADSLIALGDTKQLIFE